MKLYLIFFFNLFSSCVLGKTVKVDLQWSICEPDPQAVLQKLSEDSTREPHKQTPVTYYDTDPPSYAWHGLMFRTKTRRDQELSAIKAHFTAPTFLCVWDRYGDDTEFTCQIQSILADREKLWTDEQISFAETFQPVNWENLIAFGPNHNPKWRVQIGDYPGVFDDVQAKGLHLMELEVKVPKYQGSEAYHEITSYLNHRGIALTLRLFEKMGYNEKGGNWTKQEEPSDRVGDL
ncbi:hypothetical protein BGZ63DRAFT_415793 [Mariannaea sp. PMI_226]|nr:hypothetical protein BGZ63DRAFT_415793 [Mariannaea sp. PMI_226]